MGTELSVVGQQPPQAPEVLRGELAAFLRTLADLVEGGQQWQPMTGSDFTYEPPVAAAVVLIDSHGEPAPVVLGTQVLELEVQQEVIRDAATALAATTHRDREQIRAYWEAMEFSRQQERRREETFRLEHPCACECGRRFRTERGLSVHHRSCRPRQAR